MFTNYTQPITLGVDAGSKIIGLSATTPGKILFESEVVLRNDIVELLSTRRENRRARRNRKTRYRKPRFSNQTASKKPGWIAPSIRHKIDTHLTVIDKTCQKIGNMELQETKPYHRGCVIMNSEEVYQKYKNLEQIQIHDYFQKYIK